ncbi:UBLE1B [Lepeophtheirus salmonis]|uniref:UBLE1B n=1 Tax=Lepeophtheirus salmonis TaxID=72036 RepID=A0A817FBD9_LEPSM|nr:UBLE1B [Lepeophtheirus salmonis]CAG9475958.1 UBLE1B [Lepeophtheirus salmonis]
MATEIKGIFEDSLAEKIKSSKDFGRRSRRDRIPDYGVSFYKKFALVLNALDNNTARNHVKSDVSCLRNPVVESGTAGYLGQVSVIKKETRNASNLFGEHDADEDVSPDREDPEAAMGDAGKVREDGNVERISTRQWAQDSLVQEDAAYTPELESFARG